MDIRRDMLEAENVPELASRLPAGKTLTEGQWAYYRTRTGKWIYRMLASELKADGKWYTKRPYKLGNGSPRALQMAAFNRNLPGRMKRD